MDHSFQEAESDAQENSKRISFPLPNEVQQLIRHLPIRTKDLPEEFLSVIDKALGKLGPEFTSQIIEMWGPVYKSVIESLPPEATYEDVYRRLYEVQRGITDQSALSGTVPLLLWRNSRKSPEPHGSAVLLDIGGKLFLFTAAHVLDHSSDEGDFYLPFNGVLVCLSGMWFKTSIPPSGDRKDDNEDAAYVCCDISGFQPEPHRRNVLCRSDVCLATTGKRKMLRVAGYPARRVQVENGSVKSEANSVEGYELDDRMYDNLGLSRQRNVALKFDQKRMFSPRLNRTITPISDFAGMSGGGIYLESPVADPPSVRFQLVGIATDYDQGRGIVIGTRLPVFLKYIFRNRPELANWADQSG